MYLTVKLLHIVSATILFGTGIGTAFVLFRAHFWGRKSDIAFAARHVVIADWVFTTPAVITQIASGIWLAVRGGYWPETWLLTAVALTGFVGACWLPVVWIQIRLSRLIEAGEWKAYRRLMRWWIGLGSLAFPATLLILHLMVVKGA